MTETKPVATNDEQRRYAPWMTPGDPLHDRLAATLYRINSRVEAFEREEKEKISALEWCRANGNPHLEEIDD